MKKIKALIFFLFCFLHLPDISGHQQDINKLLQKLQHVNNDTSHVLLLNEIALAYGDTNINRSVFYARQALNLANQIDYQNGIALSNFNFGQIFTRGKSFQPAINYYLIGIKIYQQLHNDTMVANGYNKIARIYRLQGKNYQSLNYYNKALHSAEGAGIKYEVAYALNYMGFIHYTEGNYSQAHEYFLESLLIREQINDSLGLAASYNNLGEIFKIRRDFDNALIYYLRSLKINKVLNNQEWMGINQGNIGAIYMELNKFEQAYESYIQSLNIFKTSNNTSGIAVALNNLGNYYLSQGAYPTAYSCFFKAYQIADTARLLPQKSDASLGLSEVFAGENQMVKSLEYFKIHAQTKDSIFNLEKYIQIAELEARHEADRTEQQLLLKTQEIKLLERNRSITNLRYIMIIGGLILLIVIAILMYSRQRNKLKKDRELMGKNNQIMNANKLLMENELKTKDNELMNFALHIVQKNDLLQAVKDDLKEVKNKCEAEKSAKISELFLKINQNLRINTELEEFQKNVDQVNHVFFEKLKERFPNLTDNEKRLSALLRLNLSSKEIATLNNISIKAVEMGRYRLRKKLNLETNEVLTSFLQDI